MIGAVQQLHDGALGGKMENLIAVIVSRFRLADRPAQGLQLRAHLLIVEIGRDVVRELVPDAADRVNAGGLRVVDQAERTGQVSLCREAPHNGRRPANHVLGHAPLDHDGLEDAPQLLLDEVAVISTLPSVDWSLIARLNLGHSPKRSSKLLAVIPRSAAKAPLSTYWPPHPVGKHTFVGQ